MAEAFLFTAAASGTATRLGVYLDGSNAAGQVVVGLYTHNKGNPGTLLAHGTIVAPKAAAWNTVTIPVTQITAGVKYWIAILGPATTGTVQFRDRGTGTKNETSAQTDLTALPATWSPGVVYFNAPASAYAK